MATKKKIGVEHTMVKIIHGERVGKLGKLVVSCTAVVFDEARQRVLLTQRQDNQRWCLPGGHMEAGESAAEACIREVWEETGLRVDVERLVGVYSTPDQLNEYADGTRCQFVSLCFIVYPTGGTLQLSDETLAFGYFTLAEIEHIDLMESHAERLHDAFSGQQKAFIR